MTMAELLAEQRVVDDRLEAIKHGLRWPMRRALEDAIRRTYPYREGKDEVGRPQTYVTGYSRATPERIDLRARLDALNEEVAPLRNEGRELKRLAAEIKRAIAATVKAKR
jgi:hypothetical protein